jgi:hypothetical protein
MPGSAGFGSSRKIDRLARCFCKLFERVLCPLDARHTRLVALMLCHERIECFGAPHEALPVPWVGVANLFRVCIREPGIETVVAHAQGNVADVWQQPLIDVDAAGLHSERIKTVLFSIFGPFRAGDGLILLQCLRVPHSRESDHSQYDGTVPSARKRTLCSGLRRRPFHARSARAASLAAGTAVAGAVHLRP